MQVRLLLLSVSTNQNFLNARLHLLENGQDSGDCASLHKIFEQNMARHKQNLHSQLGICVDLYWCQFLDIKKKKKNPFLMRFKWTDFQLQGWKWIPLCLPWFPLYYNIGFLPDSSNVCAVKITLYKDKSLRHSPPNCSQLSIYTYRTR